MKNNIENNKTYYKITLKGKKLSNSWISFLSIYIYVINSKNRKLLKLVEYQ